MKIIEVLIENNINEFITPAFSPVVRAAIEKLASVWADDIIRATMNGASVKFSNPGRIIDRILAKNPKVLKAAKDRAKKIAGQTIGSRGATTYRTIADWATIVATVGQFVELLKPIQSYLEYMTYAQGELDSGKWNQDQFDAVRQEQVSILVGRLTAIMLTKAAMGSFGIFVGTLLRRTPLGATFNALNSAAQYAVLNKIVNSKEGIDAVAKIFTNEYVQQIAGGVGVAAIDTIKGFFPGTDAYKRKQDAATSTAPKPKAGQAAKPAVVGPKGTEGLRPTDSVSRDKIDPKDLVTRNTLRDPTALGGIRLVYENKKSK